MKKPRQGQGKVGVGPEPLGKVLDRLDSTVQGGPQLLQGLQGFRGRAEDGFAIGAVHFPQGSDQVGQGDSFGDGSIDDSVDRGATGGGGGGGCHWCVSVWDSVIVAWMG